MTKFTGHIWPEYWIDCCECEHHQPLATQKSPASAARKQGWRRKGDAYSGPWVCPECIAKAGRLQELEDDAYRGGLSAEAYAAVSSGIRKSES
jgi:hypothetical protein